MVLAEIMKRRIVCAPESPGELTSMTGPERGERGGTGERPSLDLSRLSARELDVLEYLGQGLSRAEIARRLYRSPKTIDNHCTRIYEKLGVHSQAQLVRLLMERKSGVPSRLRRGAGTEEDPAIWEAYLRVRRSTDASAGEGYFDALARGLSNELRIEFAGVSEVDIGNNELVVIAACIDDRPGHQIICHADVSPCAVAIRDGEIVCNGDAIERFPHDKPLIDLSARTYIGVGLRDQWMGDLGVLWVGSRGVIEHAEVALGVLRLLAPHVAMALALQNAVDRLNEAGLAPEYRELTQRVRIADAG